MWSDLSTLVQETITRVHGCDWIQVHPCPNNDHHYSGMQLNLSTPIQEVITLVQKCDQILVSFVSDCPCPKMWPNFNRLDKWLSLSKKWSPLFKNAIEFQLSLWVITPIKKCDQICPPLSKWWLVMSKECDQILVAFLSNCTCLNHSWKRCRLNFGHLLDKLQLKFDHVKMMGSGVAIIYNSSSLTKFNLNITWPLSSYCN
jgi:hypothetical protein